jgi:hypothetical protein
MKSPKEIHFTTFLATEYEHDIDVIRAPQMMVT